MGEEVGGELVAEEEGVVDGGENRWEGGGGVAALEDLEETRGGDGGSSLKGKQRDGSLRAVNWVRIDLKPFEKNFYNATSASRNMAQWLVEQFRYEHFFAYDFQYNDKMIFPSDSNETRPHTFQNPELL